MPTATGFQPILSGKRAAKAGKNVQLAFQGNVQSHRERHRTTKNGERMLRRNINSLRRNNAALKDRKGVSYGKSPCIMT
jgi:hypothetical protein